MPAADSTGAISVRTGGISAADSTGALVDSTGGILATGGISVGDSTGSVATGGISVSPSGQPCRGKTVCQQGVQFGCSFGGVTTVTYRDGVYTHPLVGLPRRRAGGSGWCVHVQMLELQPRRP
jgi:hypothetical protein